MHTKFMNGQPDSSKGAKYLSQKAYAVKLTSVLLVTTALSTGPAIAAGEGPTIVDRWIEDAKSYSFLDLSYSDMSYDEVTDLTEVSGFKIIVQPDFAAMAPEGEKVPEFSYQFTIPTMRYYGLREDSSRYYAKLIEAPDVTFNLAVDNPNPQMPNPLDYTGTYRGLAIKATDWAKYPDIIDDPLKPISKYYPIVAAMADANWESMTVVGVQANQDLDQDTVMEVIYSPMTMGRLVSGDYSSLKMEGIRGRTSAKGDKPLSDELTFDFSTGPITATNYNVGTLIRMFDPAGDLSVADAPFDTMLGDMSLVDAKGTFTSGGSLSLDNVSYSDIGVRAPGINILETIDSMYLAKTKNNIEPDEKDLIRLVAEFYGMFRLGSFDIDRFKIDVRDENVHVDLEKYQNAGLSSKGMENFQISGLNVEADGNKVELGNFQIADVGFPAFAALLDLERAQAEQDIAAMIAALPTIGLIELSGINAFIRDEKVDVKLGLARIKMADFIGRLPTSFSTAMENLVLPVEQLDRDISREFTALGYETIDLSYALSLVWNEAKELLSLDASTKLVDGGELKANLDIGGVKREVFEHPETAQNTVPFLTFNTASILFDDNSIVSRAIEAAAKKQDKSPEQLKQELVGMLPFALGMLNKPDFVDEVAIAVKKMLDSEGKLSATAKPAQPVSVMQVIAGGATAPGALIDLLAVDVNAD